MKQANPNVMPTYDPAKVDTPQSHRPFEAIVRREPKRVVWLRLLWGERLFLGRVTVRGLLLATVLAFVLPVRYQAKTRLMPPDERSGSGLAMLAAFAGKGSSSSSSGGGLGGALGGNLGSLAGDMLGLKSSGALFIDMLEGPTVQDGLIQRFDLRKVYWDRYWSDARIDLAKHTDITEDRKSGVITLIVTDRDPHRAQQLAQAYVEQLDQLVAQVSTSSARRERMFIEQRLKTVKQNLDEDSRQFSEFASKNGTLDVPSQTKAMVESEAQLEGNLVAAQSELEGLKQIYTDNNIRVQTLRARVAELKRQVENMSGNKADVGSENSQIAGDFPSIRKLPILGVRWADLYRESKIQETVYELLTQQYEFAKIQEAKEIPTVKVLDPAMLPEQRSFPPRKLVVFLGTLFAFLCGVMLVMGRVVWNENQSPEKQLAQEIWDQISSGRAKSFSSSRFWSRFAGQNGSGRKASQSDDHLTP
jgi:capsule polysaccharide export protein KpsE/RkpR